MGTILKLLIVGVVIAALIAVGLTLHVPLDMLSPNGAHTPTTTSFEIPSNYIQTKYNVTPLLFSQPERNAKLWQQIFPQEFNVSDYAFYANESIGNFQGGGYSVSESQLDFSVTAPNGNLDLISFSIFPAMAPQNSTSSLSSMVIPSNGEMLHNAVLIEWTSQGNSTVWLIIAVSP